MTNEPALSLNEQILALSKLTGQKRTTLQAVRACLDLRSAIEKLHAKLPPEAAVSAIGTDPGHVEDVREQAVTQIDEPQQLPDQADQNCPQDVHKDLQRVFAQDGPGIPH